MGLKWFNDDFQSKVKPSPSKSTSSNSLKWFNDDFKEKKIAKGNPQQGKKFIPMTPAHKPVANGYDAPSDFTLGAKRFVDSAIGALPFGNKINKGIDLAAEKIVTNLGGATPEQIDARRRQIAQLQETNLSPTTKTLTDIGGSVAGSIPLFMMAGPAGEALSGLGKAKGLGAIGQSVLRHGGTLGTFEALNSITHGGGPVEAAKKGLEGLLLGGVTGPFGDKVGSAIRTGLPSLMGKYAPVAAEKIAPVAHYAGNALGGGVTGLGFSYGGNALEGKPLDNSEATQNALLMGILGLASGGRAAKTFPELRLPTEKPTPTDMLNEVNRAYAEGKAQGLNRVEIRPEPNPTDMWNEVNKAYSNAKIETVQPTLKREPIPTMKVTNKAAQTAMDELNKGIETAQNYVGHNDILAAYPPGTTVEAALLDIKQNTGVDLKQLASNVEAAQKPISLTNLAERSRMGRAAGVYETPNLARGGNYVPEGKPSIQEQVSQLIRPQQPIKTPIQRKVVAQTMEPKTTEPVSSPVAANRETQPTNLRGHIKTLMESPKTAEPMAEALAQDSRGTYEKVTNQAQVDRANARVKDLDEAFRYVTTARKITGDHVVTGHRLIDEYNKSGDIEKAVDVAEKLATELTKAGQTVQAASVYNRLTTSGVLVHAQRTAQRVNERLPIGAKPAVVTDEMAAQLTDLAGTMQNMKASQESAVNVMDILSKAKAGRKLTPEESAQIKQFVNEASQFTQKVKPFKPKEPKPISDTRVRDNVINFFDAQEAKALARIKERRGRASALPLDEYADWTIVGASRIAKGTVKFTDWSEQMVKLVGEEIRPHLENIYNKAVEAFNGSSKKIGTRELTQAEKLTEKVIKSNQLIPEEADQLRELARKVAGLSGDAKIQASQDLQVVLQALDRPTILKKVSTAQTIMQLLNPKTIIRNVVGNEAFWTLEKVNRLVAAPIDWATSRFTGKREVSFLKNNQWEYWNNWFTGAKAGWKGVNPEGLSTQYDLRGRTFSNKWNPLTYLEKVMGASLQGFDYASYKRAIGQTLNEMARLDAMNKGLTGDAAKAHIEKFISGADTNLTEIAEKYGQYVTFQDANLLSTSAVKAKRLLNLNQDFGLGDVILKYPKTPANLLMRALEYSPAGFLRSAKILVDAPLGKGFNQREFTLALSRAITGTIGFSGMGYFLAKKGILTGTGNKDKDIRELEKSAGKGAYQVNVSALQRFIGSGFNENEAVWRTGDNLISYDWLQPIAVSLALGVNSASKQAKLPKGETQTFFSKTLEAAKGSSETLLEQSFLQGIQKAFDFQTNQTPMDKAVELAKDVPASFVPTLSNQVRQVTDPNKRAINGDMANSVKNKLPGLSKTLPVDYGPLGQPKQTYQKNSLFNVFLNPSFTSKYNPSPDAKLVIDLINRTGDKTVAPRIPQKTLKVDKEFVKLTPQQYSKIQQITGEETSKRLKLLHLTGNNESDVKKVLKVLDKAGEKARNELKKEIKKGP